MTAARLRVLDASVLVKCFLVEVGSDDANRVVRGHAGWIAPDLIFLEAASVAVKALRRGLIERQVAEEMIIACRRIVSSAVPSGALASQAFNLAADHGFTPYDATYLALAQAENCRLLTADRRMVERATAAGLADLIELL